MVADFNPDNLLKRLTDQQADAVKSDARRLLIVAGAGSGKTEVVARRIAWQIATESEERDRIVAFTFTERAAEELQFRVRRHLGQIVEGEEDGSPVLGGMYVGTIHGYCLKQLRDLKPDDFHNFDVLDDGGRYALVERRWYHLLAGRPLQDEFIAGGLATGHFDAVGRFLHAYDLLNEYNLLDVRLAEGSAPNPGREEEDWCARAKLQTRIGNSSAARAFADTAARYFALLRCRRFLDFSTAQAEILRQLEGDSELLNELRGRVGHLVVDEVQDINPVQARLIALLTDEGASLTAVGDHRQAIYGWRGGRVDIMGELHDELVESEDGEIVELDDNFRSTPRAIELCNRWARTIAPPGGMSSRDMTHGRKQRVDYESEHVAFLDFEERDNEAKWIADTVERLVVGEEGAAHDVLVGQRGLRHADVAILLRNARQASTYADELRARGIPVIFRGSDLFGQPEVLLMVGALGRLVRLNQFMGRSINDFISEALNCPPTPEDVIRAAAVELGQRGLPVDEQTATRLISLADLLGARIYDGERAAAGDRRSVRSTAARMMLEGSGEMKRVFPQAIYHAFLQEAGVDSIDALGSSGETVMFHLGALSSLITSIETPGWTTAFDLRSQVIGLTAWGPQGSRLPEADLLTTPDAVSIGTIHSVKGLEWPAVFVADVRARRFPSQRAKSAPSLPFEGRLAREIDASRLADNDNYDDERRLMYVALSRAERYLFVTCSGSQRSRFRRELEPLVSEVGGVVPENPSVVPGIVDLKPGERDPEAQRLVSSFSDLRYYIECPHDFYLRKVLGFAPTIDQAFGYGRGVHNIMRAIHSDPASWADLAKDSEALDAGVRELIDQGLFYLRYTTGDPLSNMREAAVRVVTDYVKTYADELSRLEFEPEREFETLLEDEQVLISGAIDVIRRDDPPQVTLVDFKSGDTQHDNAVKLDSEEMKLQVSLYGIAARAEMEYEPERGLVRYLAEEDPVKRQLEVPLDETALAEAADTVAGVARSIKQREFHIGPAKREGESRCAQCDFRNFCGIREGAA
ncbi:MAG TPA: ATP-dependent DNA helicase [Solirubrobacterales bacterium]|nr:ATP-dependent DNA helicase [Solirubrobacterales bacterium]